MLNYLSLKSSHNDYLNADPYPFVILDNYISENVVGDCYNSLMAAENSAWHQLNTSFHERKKTSKFNDSEIHEVNYAMDYIPTANRDVIKREQLSDREKTIVNLLNSEKSLALIEELTGIPDLMPDNEMRGGGFQRCGSGGYLDIHLDSNWNQKLEMCPIINLTLFLNPMWKDEFGGHIELWNKDKCCHKVFPAYNRVLIRENSNRTYHGFPNPLKCPESEFRRCLVLFYYKKDQINLEQRRTSGVWIPDTMK